MTLFDRASHRLTASLGFRQRLALLFIVTLIAVQGLTALFAYGVIRANLVEQGKNRLEATTQVFMRQLNVLSERVSDDVEILSLDYALRKAVAENDQATALSALRNHGNRIGATRMAIVALDGTITTDTTTSSAQGTAFPFTDLLDAAVADAQGTSLAVLDGVIYWIVVAPVRAPDPVAFIAAAVPVNDALLERLRELSLVTHSLALATPSPNGGWIVVEDGRLCARRGAPLAYDRSPPGFDPLHRTIRPEPGHDRAP